MPSSETVQAKLSEAIGEETWQGKFVSLGEVWPILLASLPIAIVLSVLFMFFIRFTASCFVYLLLGVAVAACIGLGIYLVVAPNSSVAGVSINKTFAIVIGALLILFGVLILIGLICYRKRIRLAAVIVQTSAKFVQSNCIISFLPFVLFFILAAFLVLWVFEALGYYSMGEPVTEDKQLPFQHFKSTGFVKAMIPIHIFQLFWVACFLI